MRIFSGSRIFLLLSITALLAVVSCQAVPAGPQIVYRDVWGPTSPKSVANGAVYLVIENKGSEADRLIGASSPVAETVELHEHFNEDGVMKMRPMDGLDIPAKGTRMLKPGGYHIMLIGLLEPLEAGNTISVTLMFEKSGEIALEAEIREL